MDNMVQVVHVTLEEYAVRVNNFAIKFESTYCMNLRPEVMDEDDRSDFMFIKMAVGDLLIKQEYFATSPPGDDCPAEKEITVEPGLTPGSTVLREAFRDRREICRTN